MDLNQNKGIKFLDYFQLNYQNAHFHVCSFPHIILQKDLIHNNHHLNFYNDNAQFLITTQILIGLQSFFKANNIDYIFFDAIDRISRERYRDFEMSHNSETEIPSEAFVDHKLVFDNLVSQENWFYHPKYFDIMAMTEENPDMRASVDDKHPNKKAHKYWGECLIEFIESKNEKV